jgi:hypothetical protein
LKSSSETIILRVLLWYTDVVVWNPSKKTTFS